MANSTPGAQTASRALQLLVRLVHEERPLTLAELSQLTGLKRGATYRILQALVDHSFVAREDDSRRYVVGSGLIALSAMVLSKQTIRSAARPVMTRIADLTSETVTLHIPHFRQRICIDVVESRLPIRRVVPIGTPYPLFAGPSGKTILAFLLEPEASDILRWAADEGYDMDRIASQLDQVRQIGYLACVGDWVPGVGSVSVPVFDSSGIAAALTVSGPADRFTQEVMDAAAPLICRDCADLSLSLGYIAGADK